MGEATGKRFDAASLDKDRPKLVRGLTWLGPFAVLLGIIFGWDIAHATSQPVLVTTGLVLVFGTTVLGAFLIGRRRQRTIRDGRDGRVMSPKPGWLGYLLAIVPGLALVASQAVGRTSAQAGSMVGLIAAYALTWGVGLALGLVVRL
jgi:hypothetical protein